MTSALSGQIPPRCGPGEGVWVSRSSVASDSTSIAICPCSESPPRDLGHTLRLLSYAADHQCVDRLIAKIRVRSVVLKARHGSYGGKGSAADDEVCVRVLPWSCVSVVGMLPSAKVEFRFRLKSLVWFGIAFSHPSERHSHEHSLTRRGRGPRPVHCRPIFRASRSGLGHIAAWKSSIINRRSVAAKTITSPVPC